MKALLNCFLNGYVLLLMVATIVLALCFYLITPILSAWWQQALAVYGVLLLEDVLTAVVSWSFYLKWKRSSKVYDTRVVGVAIMFYICYIAIGIIVGIYAWTIALWLFISTLVMALIFGLFGVGIVNAPYHTMKKFDKFIG